MNPKLVYVALSTANPARLSEFLGDALGLPSVSPAILDPCHGHMRMVIWNFFPSAKVESALSNEGTRFLTGPIRQALTILRSMPAQPILQHCRFPSALARLCPKP